MPPARPLAARSKRAPKRRATLEPPAEAPKSQAEEPKSQAEAPKSQAEAPKSQAEARKRRAEVLAPWAEEYRRWAEAPEPRAKARKLQGEPYKDTHTCIYSDEVDTDAANDDIDGDEVADCAKYDMHSEQMFCFTRWACPECRRLCFQIEQHTHYESSSALIKLYKDQLKEHLIKNSRYRLN